MNETHTIRFVTGNAGKYREAHMMIPSLVQCDIPVPEIQSLDIHEVVRAKLEGARSHYGDALVVEDTALSFHALGGLPGTFIKWFLASLGTEGLADMVYRLGERGAEVRCVVGYFAEGSSEPVFFEGRMQGTIVTPCGAGGFGWDAMFQPEGDTRTLGEYTPEEKNTVSARGQAFNALLVYLSRA